VNKYKCENCECEEFISDRICEYELYEADGETISFVETISEDDCGNDYRRFRLYCRECDTELEFDFNDIVKI